MLAQWYYSMINSFPLLILNDMPVAPPIIQILVNTFTEPSFSILFDKPKLQHCVLHHDDLSFDNSCKIRDMGNPWSDGLDVGIWGKFVCVCFAWFSQNQTVLAIHSAVAHFVACVSRIVLQTLFLLEWANPFSTFGSPLWVTHFLHPIVCTIFQAGLFCFLSLGQI